MNEIKQKNIEIKNESSINSKYRKINNSFY